MFSHDEVIMLRFLGICQPSLSPDAYEAVIAACEELCLNRRALSQDSVEKCLEHLKGPPCSPAEPS